MIGMVAAGEIFHFDFGRHVGRPEKPPLDRLLDCKLANVALGNTALPRERAINQRDVLNHPHGRPDAQTWVVCTVFVESADVKFFAASDGNRHDAPYA